MHGQPNEISTPFRRRFREGRLRRGEAVHSRHARIDGRRGGAGGAAARQPARGGVHRRRHVHRIRHSRFPLARRHLDQDDAGAVPGLCRRPAGAPRVVAAALRDGRNLERGPAQCRPPRRGRTGGRGQGQPCHHPEYRRPAPGRRRAGRQGDRAARQHPLCQMPGLRPARRDRRHPRPFRQPMAMRPIAPTAAASSRPPPSPSASPCRKTKWPGPRPPPWPAT